MSVKSSQPRHSRSGNSPKQGSRISAIAAVALSCVGILIIMLSLTKLAGDDDVFWHLATGRWIVENYAIPHQDVFGHPYPGQEWLPTGWLWDVSTYLLYSTTNSYLPLQLLPAAVWLCIFTMLAIVMLRKNVSAPITIVILLLTLVTSFGRMRPRPLIISLLGIVLIWFLFLSFRSNWSSLKSLYVLPPIFLIWSNVHLGVIEGLATFFMIVLIEHVYALAYRKFASQKSYPFHPLNSHDIKTLWFILAISVVAVCITPFGYSTFLYVYQHTNASTLQTIKEWQPPFSGTIPDTAVLWGYEAMLFLGIVSALYLIRKKDPYQVVMYVVFGTYSLRAIRFVADFAMMTAVGTALGFQYIVDRSPFALRKWLQGSVALYLLIAFMLVTMFSIPGDNFFRDRFRYNNHFGLGIDDNIYSLPLIEFLRKNHVSGKVFNQMELGGLLLWERPDEKDFHDSRILGDSIAKEYVSILLMQPGFRDKLEKYGIDYMVLHPLDLLVSPAAMQSTVISYCSTHRETWKLVYWDDRGLVYLKNVEKFKPVIDEYEYRVLHPYLVALEKRTLDSLYARLPGSFDQELERKIRQDPGGFFTAMCLAAARHFKGTY